MFINPFTKILMATFGIIGCIGQLLAYGQDFQDGQKEAKEELAKRKEAKAQTENQNEEA